MIDVILFAAVSATVGMGFLWFTSMGLPRPTYVHVPSGTVVKSMTGAAGESETGLLHHPHPSAPAQSVVIPSRRPRSELVGERRPAVIANARSMIYELRIYEAVPGRLPDLCKRFETATTKIWKKHGIVPIGFWTTLIGPNNQHLYYLLQWESLADREMRWAAFQSDPEWIAARNESQKNGVLQSTISNIMLEPTSFSALR